MFFRMRFPEPVVVFVILLNMVLQLVGSTMILARQKVMVAVGILAFVVVLQVHEIVKNSIMDNYFLLALLLVNE